MSKKNPNPDDLAYIARKPTLWAVKNRDPKTGGHHFCHFNFVDYGGESQALFEAKAWRDGIIQKHGILTWRQRNGAARTHSKSRSGVVGVVLVINARTGEPEFWRAHMGAKNPQRAHFSIKKLGYREAFHGAVEARYRMMGLPPPEPMPEPPSLALMAEGLGKRSRTSKAKTYNTRGKE